MGIYIAKLIKLYTLKYMQFITCKLYLDLKKNVLMREKNYYSSGFFLPFLPSLLFPQQMKHLKLFQSLCIFSILSLHHLCIHSQKSSSFSFITKPKVFSWFSGFEALEVLVTGAILSHCLIFILITFTLTFFPPSSLFYMTLLNVSIPQTSHSGFSTQFTFSS